MAKFKNLKNKCFEIFYKDKIIQLIFILVSAIVLIILATKGANEALIGYSGVLLGILSPYFTKEIQLEITKEQYLIQKKQEIYQKLMVLFDENISLAQLIIANLKLSLNASNEEERSRSFEEAKRLCVFSFNIQSIELSKCFSQAFIYLPIKIFKIKCTLFNEGSSILSTALNNSINNIFNLNQKVLDELNQHVSNLNQVRGIFEQEIRKDLGVKE